MATQGKRGDIRRRLSQPRIKMALRASFLKVIAIAFLLLPMEMAQAASGQWLTERDPDFGFTFSYPKPLFGALEGDDKPSFYYFASQQSDAKFLVGAWDNRAGQTPENFKRWLVANAGGYDEVTYRPRGRNWFVLSGYRGEQIYYEKVMFSCSGSVVNVFAISYPVAERNVFDPVVERMEDLFTPTRRC